MKTDIKVDMNGEEYLKYLRDKRIQHKKKKHSLNRWIKKNRVFLAICGTAVFLSFLILFVAGIFVPNVHNPSIFERWVSISWSGLLKIGFCVVLISWLIHGVKVRLLA